ncbi:MAG: glycosyltransferase family 2 protein [Methylococcaceae bacterium]
MKDTCELTILMPCLNEAETLATCIDKAMTFLQQQNINGEVLIADNGSTDSSQKIAVDHGARVINVDIKGYGAALMGGIEAARGQYIIMGDADDSYDFSALNPFVEKLREGFDLVMGSRFKGGIAPGAMPPLHRYLGNPVLTGLGRLFFKSPIGDFHCGLRGFNSEAIRKLNLKTTGMEFASEMIVKATLHTLRITEVPTTLSPDGRSRPPHLRSWRDGWRHLRFLLIFSPRWLFLYPGLYLIAIGLSAILWLMPGLRVIGGIGFDIHTMLYAAAAVIIGMQAVFFALFSKLFAIGINLFPPDDKIRLTMKLWTLERGLLVGLALMLLGILGSVDVVLDWSREDFGAMTPAAAMRIIIPLITALIAGLQIILGSFFMSILRLAHK